MVTPVNFQICGRRTYPDLNPLTHSLLRLTSEGRSDLHNERSCADDHSESIVHPTPVILFHLLYPGLPWPARWTLPVGRCPARG